MKPLRVPLLNFPDVHIHADERVVKGHPQYSEAKAGDIVAADRLAAALGAGLAKAVGRLLQDRAAELVSVHALESAGVNQIPVALEKLVARHSANLSRNRSIVQSNSVGHTGASGYRRLAHQAAFHGEVIERDYFLIDDFVGQGGTLANLIGFICSHGGRVLGAAVLTGKPYSAKLAPDESSLRALREKHGVAFEGWWKEHFGFGFDCLTRSEARYLERSPDALAIRAGLAAAGLEDGT